MPNHRMSFRWKRKYQGQVCTDREGPDVCREGLPVAEGLELVLQVVLILASEKEAVSWLDQGRGWDLGQSGKVWQQQGAAQDLTWEVQGIDQIPQGRAQDPCPRRRPRVWVQRRGKNLRLPSAAISPPRWLRTLQVKKESIHFQNSVPFANDGLRRESLKKGVSTQQRKWLRKWLSSPGKQLDLFP